MISKWLFSGALFFEVGSWASLTTQLPDLQIALLYAMSHGIACGLLIGVNVYRDAQLPWKR